MENLVLVLHLLTAIAIIALILMQQGKGAEMGASFGGGSSQTLFGASGTGNFFSRATGVLAFVFFITSISLAVIAKNESDIDLDIPLPELEVVDPEVPQLEINDNDIPVIDESLIDDEIPQVPDQ